jgi:hypothetical protein
MTLILASIAGERFWAMSDILVSVPGAHPDRAADLPLHGQPVVFATDNHTIVGTAQKSIILGDQVLIQWAGSQMVGEAVARSILEALESGRGVDLDTVLHDPEFGLASATDNAVIVHVHLPDRQMLRGAINVRNADGMDTVFAGTGAFNFLEDVETDLTARGIADGKATDRWYSRVALVLAEEFFFKDPLEHAYGGWHEVVLPLPWGGFGKASYLVKFWTIDDGKIISGPVFTSWYLDQHLCILGATGGHGPGERHKLVIVPAWNMPSIDAAAALAGFEQAMFQIHVVNNGGMMKFFWARNPWPNGFGIDLVDGQPQIAVGPEVVAKILSEDERAATMTRTSMPEL